MQESCAFSVLMYVSGGLGSLARRGLIVSGDAATTAANIMAHQSMYLLGFAGDVLVIASYVAVVGLFYRIFKPVNRGVSLINGLAALAFSAGCELSFLTVVKTYGAPVIHARTRDPKDSGLIR